MKSVRRHWAIGCRVNDERHNDPARSDLVLDSLNQAGGACWRSGLEHRLAAGIQNPSIFREPFGAPGESFFPTFFHSIASGPTPAFSFLRRKPPSSHFEGPVEPARKHRWPL